MKNKNFKCLAFTITQISLLIDHCLLLILVVFSIE